MTRPMPWRVRAAITALDIATWPLWWLLERGVKKPTTPNPKAIPMPGPCPKCTRGLITVPDAYGECIDYDVCYACNGTGVQS